MRLRGVKNFCFGFGAVGGTAAVVAVVIENYLDYYAKLPSLPFHLKAESEEQKTAYTDRPPFQKWDDNWDRRKPTDSSSDDTPTASRNIILIRHGQYNLAGATDIEKYLTPLGVKQATLTGQRLAELSLPYTHIVRSRMTRAVETADLIHKFLPEVPLLPMDSLLNEGGPIAPEPRSSWHPEYHYEVDGARIEAAFRNYFHRADPKQKEDSYEIVVCHSNVIRYFLMRALQLPPEAWLRLSLRHASTSWLVIRPNGRVHCREIGESGHLPPEMLTTS